METMGDGQRVNLRALSTAFSFRRQGLEGGNRRIECRKKENFAHGELDRPDPSPCSGRASELREGEGCEETQKNRRTIIVSKHRRT